MLLDPKAYSKQLAHGNPSSSSASSPTPTELAAGTTTSTNTIPSKTLDTPQDGDENKAYSSLEGRRAPNSPASGTPQQNVSGKPNVNSPLGTAFDPRQLLDPKSYPSKTSRSSNATPTDKSDSASETIQKKRGLEDHAHGGQGSLIENLYGVETRVNPPPKKQKTDDESTKQSNSNFPASGNTGLGDYMKEETAVKNDDKKAQCSVIDLTSGTFTFAFTGTSTLDLFQFFALSTNILL